MSGRDQRGLLETCGWRGFDGVVIGRAELGGCELPLTEVSFVVESQKIHHG